MQTDLDTKVRRVEEAKLESLRRAQVDLKQSQKEQKLAVRYHMVMHSLLLSVRC